MPPFVSDAPGDPIVTVDVKKNSRQGRVAAVPGFYLRKLDTISPAMGALSAAPHAWGTGPGVRCSKSLHHIRQTTLSGQTIRLEKVRDNTG